MRRLKIDNYINKTGDSGNDYLIKLYGAGPVTLNNNTDYKIKIGNDIGYLKTVQGKLNEESNGLILSAKDLSDFPDGTYYIEVWFEENGLNYIYPSNGKARIRLDANIETVKGDLIPTITVEELRKEIANSNTTAVKGPKGDKGDIGPQGPAGKDGIDGKNGKSVYQIWLDSGNTGSVEDFLNSLKGKDADETKVQNNTNRITALEINRTNYLTRQRPTSVRVDFTNMNDPYFAFDNGAEMHFKGASGVQLSGAWGYGNGGNATGWRAEEQIDQVMAYLKGYLILDTIRKANSGTFYVYNSASVQNPLNDVKVWDWTNLTVNPSEGLATGGEIPWAKSWYAVGLLADSQIEAMGVVRKS